MLRLSGDALFCFHENILFTATAAECCLDYDAPSKATMSLQNAAVIRANKCFSAEHHLSREQKNSIGFANPEIVRSSETLDFIAVLFKQILQSKNDVSRRKHGFQCRHVSANIYSPSTAL